MIQLCDKCSEEFEEVWMCPDSVWVQVTNAEYNMLCPRCFNDLALDNQVYLHWTCGSEEYPLETELLALETRIIETAELIDRLQTYNKHLE